MKTDEATKALHNLAKRTEIGVRVTAHGGRKGGAVEAVMAGMPTIAVQAHGLWKSRDSLLDYVGSSIRKIPFLPTLTASARDIHLETAGDDVDGCLSKETPFSHTYLNSNSKFPTRSLLISPV